MHKRWYDTDPTLSLAVSLYENSTDEDKILCANLIIEESHNLGIKIKHNITEALKFSLKRWYDKNAHIAEAMEYLKSANINDQKRIALLIINLLHKLECNL